MQGMELIYTLIIYIVFFGSMLFLLVIDTVYFNHCIASCTVVFNQLVFFILCSECFLFMKGIRVFWRDQDLKITIITINGVNAV